jgi:hypothetical protein
LLSKDEVHSPYLLSIFHSKTEVYSEKERLKSLSTLSGTEPPIPSEEEYDFLSANLYHLATFTILLSQVIMNFSIIGISWL